MKVEFPLGTFNFRPELIGDMNPGKNYYPTIDEIQKACIEIRSKWHTEEVKRRSCDKSRSDWVIPTYNTSDIEGSN